MKETSNARFMIDNTISGVTLVIPELTNVMRYCVSWRVKGLFMVV